MVFLFNRTLSIVIVSSKSHPMQGYSHNIPVPAQISHLIKHIWYANIGANNQVTPDFLIPQLHQELVFLFKGAYRKRKGSSKDMAFQIKESAVIGIQEQLIMSRPIGSVKSVGIQFHPMAFYRLFGEKGANTLNKHLPLRKFGNDSLLLLHDQLAKATSQDEISEQIKLFFLSLEKNTSLSEAGKTTKKCIETLQLFKGEVDFKEWARLNYMTLAELERCFEQFLGLSLHEARTIVKTETSYRRSNTHDDKDIDTGSPLRNLLNDIGMGTPDPCDKP